MLFIFDLLINLILIITPTDFTIPQIIIDTDIGTDIYIDDVGAIAVAHTLADRGKANILATVGCGNNEGIAAVLNVLNTYFKRPDIPIGVPKVNDEDIKGAPNWLDVIRNKYPHKIQDNSQVMDSVTVYRKVLAKQPDRSVTIITIGFLTNLANLLSTPPDSYSNMNGSELIRSKVKNLVSMAGAFPSGREYNLYKDFDSAKTVYDSWPTSVTFSGFEIGDKIKTGLPLIHNNSIHESPVKDAFNITISLSEEYSKGISSFDETAVLIGIEGYEHFYSTQTGRIHVNTDGSNTWDKNGKGMEYLVEKSPVSSVEEYINELMMR